jgi:hypothetical protein
MEVDMRSLPLLRPLLVCLVVLPFLGGAGCPGPGDDGGVLRPPGELNFNGAGYGVDFENSKLLVYMERVSTAGICAPTHGHAIEASAFALSGDLANNRPGEAELVLTVPALLLRADLEENRALFEDLADEPISDADRNRVEGAMVPEVSDDENPNLIFTFTNASTLDNEARGATLDAVVEVKGQTQSFTFTFDIDYEGDDLILSNGTGTFSRSGFEILTSNPFGGCLSDDLVITLDRLTLTPGEGGNVSLDGGQAFEQTTFPYEGDCVDDGSPAWDDTMYDILGRRCLGCHQADTDYPLAAYNDWRVDSPTEPGRPRFEAAHDLMQLPDDDSVHMPPLSGATQLPDDELQLVFDWFEAGAPPACADPAPVGFTAVPRTMDCGANVGFVEDIAPMISANFCQGCHIGDNPDIPLIDTTYASGLPDAAHPFYQPLSIWEASVERIRDLTMPPLEGWGMWFAVNGTIEADLAILDQWVADGYPETLCQ